MSAPATATPPRASVGSLAYNIAAIVLALALAGVALAYAIDAARREARLPAGQSDPDLFLNRTLGGHDLRIPASWFRYAEQRVEGFAKQIDLRFALPLGPGNALREIDVTLLPRSSVRASAKLLDGVYLHMFQPAELNGPPGLVGKPLQARNGYEQESVWYDPLSADPFVAKCSAPVAPDLPARCLRAVHLGPGMAAVYAFDDDVLERWRDFDAAVRPLLRQIGAIRP